MKLVPVMRILILSTILLIIGLAIINISALSAVDTKEPIDDKTPEVTNTDNEVIDKEEFSPENEKVGDLNNIDSTNEKVTIYNIGYIAFIILFSSLIALGYQHILNTPELQDLVNTNLKLAGFDQTIGIIGRSWQIDSHTKIILVNGDTTYFKIKYQLKDKEPDPVMYGFRVSENTMVTKSHPEGLQLTLQSLRRYINSAK